MQTIDARVGWRVPESGLVFLLGGRFRTPLASSHKQRQAHLGFWLAVVLLWTSTVGGIGCVRKGTLVEGEGIKKVRGISIYIRSSSTMQDMRNPSTHHLQSRNKSLPSHLPSRSPQQPSPAHTVIYSPSVPPNPSLNPVDPPPNQSPPSSSPTPPPISLRRAPQNPKPAQARADIDLSACQGCRALPRPPRNEAASGSARHPQP